MEFAALVESVTSGAVSVTGFEKVPTGVPKLMLKKRSPELSSVSPSRKVNSVTGLARYAM